MTTQEERAEHFQRAPRPLDFVRVRLYRGGQAEYILELLEDEKEALFEELGNLRGQGVDENTEGIGEIRQNLRHLINILRDLNNGLVELRGPDGF